jgi:HEAT repeat protein
MRSTPMIRLIPLGLAAVVVSLQLAAQTSVIDNARKLELQQRATAIFLERGRPETERLEAAKAVGWPDAKTFPRLLAAGTDRGESDAIRLQALLAHRRFNRQWLEAVLKILDDPSDGGALLDAGLIEELNRRASFRLPAEVRQRILTTWRKLLKDPRDRVRLAAFRVLAANHDPQAVNQLDESLRRGRDLPTPARDAIVLLDVNGAMNHITALRPYLSHSDPAVQAKAARALALDPDSRPRIVELATNPRTPEPVRLQALRGLAREDETYASYVLPLLENRQEDPDVRRAAMRHFAGRMNYQEVSPRDQIRFAEAVERISEERALGSEFQKAARDLLIYLRQAFPVVAKHYEGR